MVRERLTIAPDSTDMFRVSGATDIRAGDGKISKLFSLLSRPSTAVRTLTSHIPVAASPGI